jgi:hypothetical protein
MIEKRPKQTALIPMMVDDPKFSDSGLADALVERGKFQEDYFLAGPVTRRVAVLDFDENTGALLPGVPYQQPKPGNVLGHYALEPDHKKPRYPDVTTRAFNQVSTFATVLKTIKMFEKEDVLGREVQWAFDAPQLLVVPRAGRDENAYYERDSHSVQFFFFSSRQDEEETVFTSLARDIVAHETGHAILDGIAPHLWFAITPQSRALHEAIADLTALLVSIDSSTLRRAVLEKTNGSIQESTHFSAVAEQFGIERGQGALRNLYDENLVLDDHIRAEEHDLCRVLTAALYSVLMRMHDDRKKQEMDRTGKSDYSVSGRALFIAAAQFRRMILRALDYLPPGEISFADYGRAIIAPDQIAHPDDNKEREWLCSEFVRRQMVSSPSALAVDPPPEDGLKGVDLRGLMDSDWVAYDFANSARGRKLLGIPNGVRFHVEPRLMVEREYFHRPEDGAQTDQKVGECLFKVWWYQQEENRIGPGFPDRRQVVTGTTMAWDRDTGKLRAILSTARPDPDELAKQQQDRDLMLAGLADEGLLRPGSQPLGPDGRPLRLVASIETTREVMRVSNVARMLHCIEEV